MALSTFCIMMNGSNKACYFNVRKQIVQHAQKFGIKPTAKKWAISKNTVKTWLRRFLQEGNQGLYDKRKGPLNIPHKTPAEIEKKVIDARLQVPCYGPKRLKYFFELPCGENAIARILKQHNLSKKPKKKYQIKNDLREAKARYKALGHMQMDVKYLKDIPNYWGQKKRFKLPCFEYTLRDTKSGMLFLGFSDELSELNARSFLHYALKGLRKHIPLEKIIIQTDNGVEFSGGARSFKSARFTQAVNKYNAEHVFIPPGLCNANGDVESLHNLIEKEFFNLGTFNSREDFFNKVESYRLFFNLERPNSYKQGKTPWLIAQNDWPDCDLASHAAALKVVDLDKISGLEIEGQGMGGYPASLGFTGNPGSFYTIFTLK